MIQDPEPPRIQPQSLTLHTPFYQFFSPPPDFKVLGGGKGEVKPPKCPTRHSGLADTQHMVTISEVTAW